MMPSRTSSRPSMRSPLRNVRRRARHRAPEVAATRVRSTGVMQRAGLGSATRGVIISRSPQPQAPSLKSKLQARTLKRAESPCRLGQGWTHTRRHAAFARTAWGARIPYTVSRPVANTGRIATVLARDETTGVWLMRIALVATCVAPMGWHDMCAFSCSASAAFVCVRSARLLPDSRTTRVELLARWSANARRRQRL